ncbi:class I SAM-dependent methyltransferase [bacterium]|nr:class I SAM-dependent methyltransferase [bacterium]
MSQQLSLEEIREFWSQQAILHGQKPDASWSDYRVIEMEIREIISFLQDGDRVLDVGCANGFSSIQFVMSKALRVHGVDYIPEMIDMARQRLSSAAPEVRERLSFAVGDAMDLSAFRGQYDKVVVVRVIINLGEWPDQLRAIQESCQALKPGGLLIMSEATIQGWQKLNDLRREWGLEDIAMPGFNNYLDCDKVVESLSPGMKLEKIVNFASTYFVGTRVLKPLLIRSCKVAQDAASPDMEFNRFFSMLPAVGDYGTQKLFVFRKS